MIVRILGEGQFRLSAYWLDELNALDAQAVDAVARGEAGELRRVLEEMEALVRREGQPVPAHELVESDVVLPSPDMALEEARAIFTGEGLVPG